MKIHVHPFGLSVGVSLTPEDDGERFQIEWIQKEMRERGVEPLTYCTEDGEIGLTFEAINP